MSNGAFRIVEKINESATTAVYRADHLALGRTVLLKVLHRHLASDAEFSTRFSREARACAQIHSPHIVQVFDLTEVDGAPAIVMEFVQGRSLKQVLAEDGPLPLDRVRAIASAILAGLSAAHEHGIIHRDLKPGNILVSQDGTVKITDFGLATILSANSITQEGMVLGTPAYMSPEQSRGETLDARSDLFSLGVTIVELLTGKRIFDGESYSECLRKIAAFRASHLKEVLPNIDGSFLPFLQRMMGSNPVERFVSAAEALAVLEERIPLPPLRKPRDKTFLRIAAVAIAVLIFLIALSWYQFFRDDGEGLSSVRDSSLASDRTTTELQQPTTERQQSASDRASLSSRESSTIPTSSPQKSSAPLVNDLPPVSNAAIPDSGFLRISAKPWARVTVNGQPIGETPLAAPLRVPRGMNIVMFAFNGFEPITRTVDVKAEATIPVEADFLQFAGYVTVQAIPWAYVYLDGRYCDVTPFHTPLVVPTGSRVVRFNHPSLGEAFRNIMIQRGETTRVVIDMRNKEAHVPQ